MSKHRFSPPDLANPTLDDGVFFLDNSPPAERIHSLSYDGLCLALKSSNYLVETSFVLENSATRTLHAVLETGAGRNLVRFYVLPIGWCHKLIRSVHLLRFCDAIWRPFQLLGMFLFHLRLGDSRFQVPFILPRQLAASIIIGTEFLHSPVRAIR